MSLHHENDSAHVAVDEGQRPAAVLRNIRNMLHDRFGIDHLTIQIEPEGFPERGIPV